MQHPTRRLGAPSEAKPATPEVQAMCDELKPEVEKKHGKTFEVFTAVEFKSQVVSGMNYFIKVKVGDGQHISVSVHRPLPQTGKPICLLSNA